MSTDEAQENVPATESLDPSLLPYLDWPLWVRESALKCNKGDCPCEDGDIHEPGDGRWILSERTTLRTILQALQQHAEATRG